MLVDRCRSDEQHDKENLLNWQFNLAEYVAFFFWI